MRSRASESMISHLVSRKALSFPASFLLFLFWPSWGLSPFTSTSLWKGPTKVFKFCPSSLCVLLFRRTTNFHSCFQQVLLGAALIVSIANVLFTVFHPNNPVPVLYSYLLEPFTLTSILIFTYFNHTRTRSSSTLLLIFWPLYIVATAAWIRTVMSRDLDRFLVILSLKCATLGLAAVAFGFECKGPEFEDNFGSPILTANIYSIWVTFLINHHRNGVIIVHQSFSWMSPLVKKGAIQFITEDDLPPLKPADESYNLGEDLKQALKNR